MSDKIYIEWSDFHQDVKFLCQKIKESGSYNRIIAVSRGGLIPAGIISYELSIRNTFAALAQLVEHMIRNHVVACSIHAGGTS